MSGWSAFWLHLYFSLLLLSLPSPACNCVRSLEDSSRLVFHSFTIFIPSFWFSGATDPWEWGLGCCLIFVKDWFFLLHRRVGFLVFGFKILHSVLLF